ncbi:hypothetical protein BBJ28_00011199 [Nothophytophthora sp. Chile5]|nr:hypothetical protein BBJ28_00011199 [Nothophytophthora sp. Chile5]
MAELAILIGRLPLQPSHPGPTASGSPPKPLPPSASATGSGGFKLSLLSRNAQSPRCCLVFRNFYVAALRLVQVNVDGSSVELASAFPLMQHVHCEDDAQNWQLVRLDQLPVGWDPSTFDSLCVYLSQPSPLWETWELRDVRLYALPPDQQKLSAAQQPRGVKTDSNEAPTMRSSGGQSSFRLEKRASGRLTQLLERRSSLTPEPSMTPSVEELASRCLDLVLRLRALQQH